MADILFGMVRPIPKQFQKDVEHWASSDLESHFPGLRLHDSDNAADFPEAVLYLFAVGG